MEYIHKLPFIVGSFMAIVVGMVNYKLGIEQQEVFTRMAISLVLFFAVGLVLRNLLNNIFEEVEKKKKEQEELEEKEKQIHSKAHNENGIDTEEVEKHNIDYRIDDTEEFLPLKVSEILNSTNEK